jgi:hypothetical protein
MMYRRHVFADPAFLTDDLLSDRMRLTHQPGARFASACFVTGALDPSTAEPLSSPLPDAFGARC